MGKWIGCVETLITKIGERTAAKVIGTSLRNNIDDTAACPAEFRVVVATVDLKFLHRLLTERRTYAAALVIRLSTVNGDAITATIIAVKRYAALWRLGDTKIRVIGESVRVDHARREQCECQIITTVDRQIADKSLVNSGRLLCLIRLDRERIARNLNDRRRVTNL